MSDDDELAGPSLLLARHDNAQREHLHRHQHHHFHKRQHAPATRTVTEPVQTVSILKEVEVDGEGHTLTIKTIIDGSTYMSAAPTAATSVTSRSRTPRITRHTTAQPSSASQPSQSLPPSQIPSSTLAQSESTVLTATPGPSSGPPSPSVTPPPATPAESEPSSQQTPIPSSTPSPIPAVTPSESPTINAASAPLTTAFTPPNTASFSSFIVPPNSTTLISSSSASPQTYSNSSTSLTHLTVSDASSTGRSTSTRHPHHTSSDFDIPTITVGTAGFLSTGLAPPAATATSGFGQESQDSSAPPTSVVVGSVVGSLAGASLVILVLLVIVKWWKRRQNGIALGDGEGPESGLGGVSSRGMIERRSLAQAVPAALAGLAGYKRSSQKPDPTVSPTADGEKGFYRVSGRKIQSVLQSGGDGYGDDDVGGASFYKESGGFYGGAGAPHSPTSPSSSPVGISVQRDGDNPVMRPGPARTAVTQQGPFSSMVPPSLNVPGRRPDAVGRSRPSQDSSHPSRFTELV